MAAPTYASRTLAAAARTLRRTDSSLSTAGLGTGGGVVVVGTVGGPEDDKEEEGAEADEEDERGTMGELGGSE
jgi:hypothetical protein